LFAPLRRWTHGIATYPASIEWPRIGAWHLPLVGVDHLYASPKLRVERIRRATIPGSDHFAIVADLTRPI